MISLLVTFILYCTPAGCERVQMSQEALAVMACESGDTQTLGSYSWDAVNVNNDGTRDGGAFQFNDYWVWNPDDGWILRQAFGSDWRGLVAMYPSADKAPAYTQYQLFQTLWDDGRGWSHWASSRPCWSKWMYVQNNQATWR
jgi:hypothetical protein